jgi:hypothetical protein
MPSGSRELEVARMTERQPGAGRFRRGDVVRSKEGRPVGVVLHEECLEDGGAFIRRIHALSPGRTVAVWAPEELSKSNDADSVQEAERLGLRLPPQGADNESFAPGDVVKSRDGRLFGVVLHVEPFRVPQDRVELHVDMPREGVGIWRADDTVLSNDPDSIAKAKRLGLRFPLGS